MDALVTLLVCAVAFLLYLLNRQRHEIADLKAEVQRLQSSDNGRALSTPIIDENTFVRVIFKAGDKKYYDYFVGDNDVRVGDFVEVYFNNKASGKVERRTAKVIYVSEPGEVSDYARSKIKRKVDRPKW